MKCIDFDSRFADFTSQWMKQHSKEYRNYDAMEEDLPRVYTAFLNTPAKWLDGVTPGAYFTQYEDAKDLVDWLCAYCEQGISVPDLLLDQILAVGKPCEKRLVALLKDDTVGNDAKMTAIGVLRDMESTQPKMLYIAWQLDRDADDELADNAVDSLIEMGPVVTQPILEVLPKANAAGEQALLDVLVNFPCTEQVYKLTVKLFHEHPERRALLASYLGKLGDTRALPILIDAANDDNLRYFDFIELRNAIEMLGGDAPEREFFDDAEYEALNGAGQ